MSISRDARLYFSRELLVLLLLLLLCVHLKSSIGYLESIVYNNNKLMYEVNLIKFLKESHLLVKSSWFISRNLGFIYLTMYFLHIIWAILLYSIEKEKSYRDTKCYFSMFILLVLILILNSIQISGLLLSINNFKL